MILLLLMAAWFAARATPLTILYTNDLHLRFSRLDSLSRRIETERQRSENLLLLDAGDTFQDFRDPMLAVWGGDRMVAWMNRIGYDAMALGNHDLYWGPRRLETLIGEAGFPILCANVLRSDGSVAFTPWTRIEVGGLDVVVIGLTTRDYFPFLDYPLYRVTSPATAVEAVLGMVPKDFFDVLVCLGHLSVAEAERIASQVPQIAVFVTGHSHEATIDPVMKGNTIIVQSGAFGRALGRLDLEVDVSTRTARTVSNQLLPTEKAPADTGRGLVQLAVVAAALVALLAAVVL